MMKVRKYDPWNVDMFVADTLWCIKVGNIEGVLKSVGYVFRYMGAHRDDNDIKLTPAASIIVHYFYANLLVKLEQFDKALVVWEKTENAHSFDLYFLHLPKILNLMRKPSFFDIWK